MHAYACVCVCGGGGGCLNARERDDEASDLTIAEGLCVDSQPLTT